MRLSLLFSFVVSQWVAPWFCCCVIGSANATEVSLQELVKSESLPPAPQKCKHCCEEQEAPLPPVTPEQPPQEKPTHHCPCAKIVPAEVYANIPDRIVDRELLDVAAFTFALPTLSPWVVIVDSVAVPNLRSVPLLTTEDILYTHHVLRC